MAPRAAGLLLHPTSLPGRFGIGDLGPSADAVPRLGAGGRSEDLAGAPARADRRAVPLRRALRLRGQPAAPLAREARGGGPAFRGNRRGRAGLSRRERLVGGSARVEGPRSCAVRGGVRRRRRRSARSMDAFREAAEQRPWLADWSRFAARRALGNAPQARELSDEVLYQEFLQLLFFRQWERLRREATRRGIALFGDVPIYVAPDSADVGSHPDLFALDARRAADRGRRRAARLLQRDRAAVGQSALPLGPDGGGRLRLVDRAASRRIATDRHRAARPLPRLRPVLGGARGRADGRERSVASRARGARSSTPSVASSATSRSSPKTSATITPDVQDAARRDRHARHEGPPVRLLRRRRPVPAAPPRSQLGRLHRDARQRHGPRLVERTDRRRARAGPASISAATARRSSGT